MAFLEFEYN